MLCHCRSIYPLQRLVPQSPQHVAMPLDDAVLYQDQVVLSVCLRRRPAHCAA